MFSAPNKKAAKEQKLTKKYLDGLRERITGYHQQKKQLDELLKKKEAIDKKITILSQSLPNEKEILNLATIQIDNTGAVPLDGLSEQEQKNIDLVMKLRNLIDSKYAIKAVRFEYNVVNEKSKLIFSKGQFVHGQLACQPAIDYFKGIKGAIILHTGSSHLDSVNVMLTIPACQDAIRGLEIVNTKKNP